MARPAVIDHGDEITLDAVDASDVLDRLAEHGSVHLRGFDCDEAGLDRISNRFCDRFTCDPAKVVTGGLRGSEGQRGRAARVASRHASRVLRRTVGDSTGARARYAPFGGFGINPHTENAFLPDAAPDLVWFACLQPAASGGDSTLVDGSELLGALDDHTERWIRTNEVRYTTTLSEAQWRSVWDDADLTGLRQRLADIPGVTIEPDAGDHSLTITYDSLQVGATLFGDREAIRTNLMSRHPYDRIGRDHAERTADGRSVDRDVLVRLLDATRPAHTVRLEAGDVLLIDNTRVMHGRTPFEDTSRRVITRCGWLRDDLCAR